VFALTVYAGQPTPTAVPPQLARVLIISMDGARPDAILQADTPHIQALAQRGAVDWTAQTIFPPATLPAHASMLTGLEVEQHGLSDNDSVYPCPVLETPTFLTLAHNAGYKVAMVAGKQQFCRFHQIETVDYSFAREGDRSVVDQVIKLLTDDYQVIFAHFPNPDYIGHSAGWMSDSYLYEFANTDLQIGRLLVALDDLDLTDTTLVILTADHGGHDDVHGADIPEDMTIPWIIAGPGVAAGTNLSAGEVRIVDTAATVLWALDLPLPGEMAGRVVTEAFSPAVPARTGTSVAGLPVRSLRTSCTGLNQRLLPEHHNTIENNYDIYWKGQGIC
jgi:arylsulfatase A-like enzyme